MDEGLVRLAVAAVPDHAHVVVVALVPAQGKNDVVLQQTLRQLTFIVNWLNVKII